jgi:hypothetical protein
MFKRITLVCMILIALVLISNPVFARGIGAKIGYGWMLDDYDSAKFKDQLCFGIYGDLGRVVFDKLDFRPSIDYIKLETSDYKWADVWGFHFDWYWFFMGESARIRPFLGFGPAINYYNFKHGNDDDTDAGLELFGGVEFDITGPISLMIEPRYVFHDLADLNQTIFKLYAGVLYKF